MRPAGAEGVSSSRVSATHGFFCTLSALPSHNPLCAPPLVQKFEKDKVISQKVIRKQDHISAINRAHPAYLAASAAGGGGDGSNRAGAAASGSGKPVSGTSAAAAATSRVAVEYCWRVPSSLREIFGPAAADDKDRLYTQPEVVVALQGYAEANGLAAEAGGRPSVRLDRLLLGLFSRKEELGEGSLVPTEVSRVGTCLARCVECQRREAGARAIKQALGLAVWHTRSASNLLNLFESPRREQVLVRKLLDKLQQWHRLVRPSELVSNGSGQQCSSPSVSNPVAAFSLMRPYCGCACPPEHA